ncbi:hypothetical protein BV22DRAFT_1067358 [Leucogyrophana mollusca]|uniref:Uncharacterized protein n=1 Tax=Leucogyrophana mollusca TaxID=85980 RepID=A0ACB8BFC0_9AGAM|nr:hypothetical protein BV22DRAFT_1067358 [Leucogyrophana mollusca]
MDSLYDRLQAEFCPPLDSSLLAALIAELEPGDVQPNQLESLRATLRELANHAEQVEQELSDEFEAVRLSSQYITTDDSCSTPDFFGGDTPTSSTASDASAHSFSSPLGFLQAALPHIPSDRLRIALDGASSGDSDDVDMESVVEGILTSEYLRELEERGLEGLESADSYGEDPVWETASPKRKTPVNGKVAKKKNARGKTITLVDIRQKQHNPPSSTPISAPDPWTQLSSLSSHVATLLPPHPPSFFQSYFHSPEHATPAAALRAALSSIADSGPPLSPSDSSSPAVLFALLDVLRSSPAYDLLDSEQRSTLYSDAQLTLAATHGRADDAIDVVWLLHELDSDSDSGALQMGVYHLPSPASPTLPHPKPPALTLPAGPPPIQPPPTSKRKSPAPSPSARKPPNPFEWHAVPARRAPSGGPHPHPLAAHIPAYATNGSPTKVRGSGNGLGKGGKGDVGELGRRRTALSLRKRDELLREASKAWSRGNAKTRGGEVALYFAERAREFQELARREALNEARSMVESKRAAAADKSTVDLHGTCVAEAVVIVREILERDGCSSSKPLKIITGRGTHSAGRVSVLKPAVKSALVQEGWSVGMWDGGLVVRGRRPGFVG